MQKLLIALTLTIIAWMVLLSLIIIKAHNQNELCKIVKEKDYESYVNYCEKQK